MTAKGAAAISSIQLIGEQASEILKDIFRPTGKDACFETGKILLGDIVDGTEVIDQVVIGCEGENNFTINCHGNPLIVELVMELLCERGAEVTGPEKILEIISKTKNGEDTIATEKDIAMTTVKTLAGAGIINRQTKMGLKSVCQWWLDNIDKIQIEDIREGADHILQHSRIAGYIIQGVRIVLAGPPNSGKSTLLNRLCGSEKAIVTDIAGTTRDWVTGHYHSDLLSMELVDTAGLDKKLSVADNVDSQSQKRAKQLLRQCDLVLLVLDGQNDVEDLKFSGQKVLVVLNKSDLGKTPGEKIFPWAVTVSAKTGDGIKKLIDSIHEILEAADFDTAQAICFTARQKKIMAKIAKAETKEKICTYITELLNGNLTV